MAILAVPSLYSATISTQPHRAASDTGVTPWRGILAVEPDRAVLTANSILLTNANYHVTQATGDGDLFSMQSPKAFALAILSDRLGKRLLRAVARIVRKQWPRARILIVGQAAPDLEDYLYDEQISRSSDPQQVLAHLDGLYEGMWNRRSGTLDWDATRSRLCFPRQRILESDPTKTLSPAWSEGQSIRDRPSDIRLQAARRT